MKKTRIVRLFIFPVFILLLNSVLASAQSIAEGPISRVAIVASEAKTNIWVSDFPKSSTVVIFDEEDNLISIVSTNEYGAAFLSLPKAITSTIFAKTMNGEIIVSNKAKQIKQEQHIASADQNSNASKA